MKLFLQKNAKFSSAVGSAPDSRAPGGWGLRPQNAKHSPPIANFWLRACAQDEIFTAYNEMKQI